MALVAAHICVQTAIELEIPPNAYSAMALSEEEKRALPIELVPVKDLVSDRGGHGFLSSAASERVAIVASALPGTYVNAGSNRLLSWLAALVIISQDPIVGVGQFRADYLIPHVASSDPGGVSRFFKDPEAAWRTVRGIYNPSLKIFAELGVIGLVLFWLVCGGMIAIFWKAMSTLRVSFRQGDSLTTIDSLGIVAAVWGLTFVVLHQTTGWIDPGHMQLVWLAACLGLASVAARNKLAKGPAATANHNPPSDTHSSAAPVRIA
jgi:O-antigen ligase